MAALNSLLLLRRACSSSSSSFLITGAIGSLPFSFRPLHSRLSASRSLPFSTTSADSPTPKTSHKSPPATDTRDRKRTTPEISFPEGLPFDYINVCRDDEYMYLRRKTKDEIIHISVSTHTIYDENDAEQDYLFVFDDSNVCDDSKWIGDNDAEDDSDEMVMKKDRESNEDGVDEEEKKSNEVGYIDEEEEEVNGIQMKEIVDREDKKSFEVDYTDNDDEGYSYADDDEDCAKMLEEMEDDEVPRLTLSVTIFYGDNFDRCMKFVLRAYPDDHDKLFIHSGSFRKARKGGEPVGLDHLDEFEGFFKKRGLEATNLNYLFKCIDNKNQFEKHCDF